MNSPESTGPAGKGNGEGAGAPPRPHLPPVYQDRGRDPLTASFRLFKMVREDLKVMEQRVVHVTSAVTELRRLFTRIRGQIVHSPIYMGPEALAKIETEIHSGVTLLQLSTAAMQGVSARLAMGKERVETGIQFGSMRPQPSLN